MRSCLFGVFFCSKKKKKKKKKNTFLALLGSINRNSIFIYNIWAKLSQRINKINNISTVSKYGRHVTASWEPLTIAAAMYSTEVPQKAFFIKSIAGRYWPVWVADRPITARYRFIKNASWVEILCGNTELNKSGRNCEASFELVCSMGIMRKNICANVLFRLGWKSCGGH